MDLTNIVRLSRLSSSCPGLRHHQEGSLPTHCRLYCFVLCLLTCCGAGTPLPWEESLILPTFSGRHADRGLVVNRHSACIHTFTLHTHASPTYGIRLRALFRCTLFAAPGEGCRPLNCPTTCGLPVTSSCAHLLPSLPAWVLCPATTDRRTTCLYRPHYPTCSFLPTYTPPPHPACLWTPTYLPYGFIAFGCVPLCCQNPYNDIALSLLACDSALQDAAGTSRTAEGQAGGGGGGGGGRQGGEVDDGQSPLYLSRHIHALNGRTLPLRMTRLRWL